MGNRAINIRTTRADADGSRRLPGGWVRQEALSLPIPRRGRSVGRRLECPFPPFPTAAEGAEEVTSRLVKNHPRRRRQSKKRRGALQRKNVRFHRRGASVRPTVRVRPSVCPPSLLLPFLRSRRFFKELEDMRWEGGRRKARKGVSYSTAPAILAGRVAL